MPQRVEAPVGAPCWIDLFSSDTDKACAFYGELFGWTWESAGEEFGGYINFFKDGVHVAGCMRNDGSMGAPDAWTVYLATDNALGTTQAAAANGGQVHMDPHAIPNDLGTMGLVADPGTAAVGLWQPGQHKGFGVHAEPGAPAWFELHTRHYDAAVDFYRNVFGWDARVMSDTDDFRYTTLGEGDDALAGIMDATSFLPEDVPAHWSIYFGTADTDASVEKVVALGGTVVHPGHDSPYGRLAQVADPTGALFKLVQDN